MLSAAQISTAVPGSATPVAVNDNVVIAEDTLLPTSLNVLLNDTGDTPQLQVVHVEQPLGAAVTIGLVPGTVSIDLDPNWDQDFTFEYTVCDADDLGPDATRCDTAEVLVHVTAINDAPLAADDLAATAENTSTIITVLNNDTDVDLGDTATLEVISVTDPLDGTASLLPNGTIEYTPDAGFAGPSDTFDYTVSDIHGATSTATVTVFVSEAGIAPTAVPEVVSTPEDTPIDIDVLANDFDSYNNGPLTINAIETETAHGNVTANLNVIDGMVHYIPDPQYNGFDSFTYLVCNVIGACSTGEVQITVESTNDLPVARDDFMILDEDATYVSIDALSNDSDEDANDGPAPVPAQTLYIHRAGPAPISGVHPALDGPDHGIVTITGTGTSSKLQYTPNADYNSETDGPDSFEYEICDTFDDPGQTGTGGCAVATVFINVKLVNDPPLAVDDSATMAEDGVAIDIDVLANDKDDDDTTLLIASVEQPLHGSVYINAGQINYTPDANYHGTDSFEYTVSDSWNATDVGLVTITVGNVNDAPNALDDIATTPELNSDEFLEVNLDGYVLIDVLANDSDNDGQTLTFPVQTLAPDQGGTAWITGGKIRYLPADGFVGLETFTYTVCDPIGGITGCSTATVKVFVLDKNLSPVGVNDLVSTNEDTLVSIPVLLNDYDPNGDPLHIDDVEQPEIGAGEVSVNGSNLEFTPALNFSGEVVFYYVAGDNTGAVSGKTRVKVIVKARPDNPNANDDLFTTDENVAISLTVLANDDDPDNGDSIKICTNGITIPPVGGFATIEAGQKTIRYTPGHGFSGHDSLEYKVCDAAGNQDTAVVQIVVFPVNSTPDAIDDIATTPAGTPVDINVKFNDQDLDGDTLTVTSIVSQPSHGSATINADNTVHYVPDFNFEGQDSFTYSVCDPDDACDTATVTVSVGHDDTATISGSVYFDLNGNGAQDLGESDIQGVKVQLFKWNAGTGDYTDLVSAGTIQSPYQFTDLPAGAYKLVIDPTTVPQGLVYTDDPSGALDGEAQVSVGAGSNYSGQDFGLWLGADLPETR